MVHNPCVCLSEWYDSQHLTPSQALSEWVIALMDSAKPVNRKVRELRAPRVSVVPKMKVADVRERTLQSLLRDAGELEVAQWHGFKVEDGKAYVVMSVCAAAMNGPCGCYPRKR